jgi:methionyl-tRNA formyltransferase
MVSKLRIIFFGTSGFAIPALDSIIGSSHELLAVVSRPARPAGRGRRITEPPVPKHIADVDVPVFQPGKISTDFVTAVREMRPDVMVTASYGAWLPAELLSASRLGVVNIHPSLLPQYRGAAPVVRAILDGMDETGVSFMLTDNGWDTGPVLDSYTVKIMARDTAGSLEDRLAELSGGKLIRVLERYASGELVPRPQTGEAVYAEKVSTGETWISWDLDAVEIERMVRAFQPQPGARTSLSGRLLKIVEAEIAVEELPPGEVLVEGERLLVGCGGGGSLEILRLQPASKRVMTTAAFLRGAGLRTGERLGGEN